jgi:hypothetical protein
MNEQQDSANDPNVDQEIINPFYRHDSRDITHQKAELADPVKDLYIELLQNIRNLCLDESICDILLDA